MPRKKKPPAAEPAPRPKKKTADILSAADLPAARPNWLWNLRLLFGSVGLLAGDQSAGKSTLAAAIAAAVTKGRPLPGGPSLKARSVLWLGVEEDPAEAIRPRLRLAGADLARVYFPERLAAGGRRRICLPLHAAELLRLCRDYDAALIILDPITSHVEPGMLADSGQTARAVLESLAQTCQEAGACCLAIKHPRKGNAGSLIERVSGSREWVQVPRTVLYLASPDPLLPGRVLVTLKPGPPQRPPALAATLVEVEGAVRFEWAGETVIDPDRIGKPDDLPGERDAAADARTFLRSVLAEGQQRVADLERWARDAGLSMSTLRRVKEREGVATHHEGSNAERAWYWSLPK